ncbi:MAG: FtsW/RodA/SpoVE family cell cycle protein, partial [Victivallales bacterium]|nr:FtsW/RodA/SpoVE family cell cycle protein [Victivallales bacterium]
AALVVGIFSTMLGLVNALDAIHQAGDVAQSVVAGGLMVCLIGLACVSQDRVGMLICMGFCVLVTMQSIVNIGVISGWGPTTGVTAPYISYGGSSILSLLLCTGLVFNVCKRTANSLREKHVKGSNLPSFEEIRSVMNEGIDSDK